MTGISLDGHRALVTGGAHGIGRAIAEAFVAAGARVVVLDRDAEGAAEVAGAIGGTALTCDVADGNALAAAVDEAAAALGGLSLLVNNAGIGMAASLHAYSDEQWRRLLAVNLDAAFVTMRAAVPHLRAAEDAAVVNVAGLTASKPNRGEGPYNAAKAGLVALTKTAALEYAPVIRVNSVSPGYVATRLTAPLLGDESLRARIEGKIPAGRIADASEVADVVTFLASPLAGYITGVDLVIDGGASLPSAQSDDLMKGFLTD